MQTGQSRQVTCENIYEFESDSVRLPIVIDWTDISTSTSRTQSGDDLVLVGPVSQKYMSVLNEHASFDLSSLGCFNDGVSPIPLCTCFDLNEVRNHLSSDFVVQNNIDFLRCNQQIQSHGWNSGAGWVPIGDETGGGSPPANSFIGNLDGQNNFIANLFINKPEDDSVGFFGSVYGYTSEIKNVGFTKVDIIGQNQVGGIIGAFQYGSIHNSYVIGNIEGNSVVGGLVGRGYGGISNSYTKGSVVSISSVPSSSVGGLIGATSYSPNLTNSYSLSTVRGSGRVGGLVASAHGFKIVNSYFGGRIESESGSVGGLVGFESGHPDNDLENSYWNTETSGQSDAVGSGSSLGGVGLTTQQMKQRSSFTGFDFSNTWQIQEGQSYPFLRNVPRPSPLPGAND